MTGLVLESLESHVTAHAAGRKPSGSQLQKGTVLTNTKFFEVSGNAPPVYDGLKMEALLVYADTGDDVPPNENGPALTGLTICTIIHGKLIFRVKVRDGLTSKLRGGRCFRVKVTPCSSALTHETRTELTNMTGSFICMVKPSRPGPAVKPASQPAPIFFAPVDKQSMEMMIEANASKISELQKRNHELQKELQELQDEECRLEQRKRHLEQAAIPPKKRATRKLAA
tara:strand:+ start:216 stop:896 length:681 start_codon:yes stop_codon:yes gene_type:complete